MKPRIIVGIYPRLPQLAKSSTIVELGLNPIWRTHRRLRYHKMRNCGDYAKRMVMKMPHQRTHGTASAMT